MVFSERLWHVLIGVMAGAAITGGGLALAATRKSEPARVIHACVNDTTRVVEVRSVCGHGSRAISWNQKGVRGATGARGPKGPAGSQGRAGIDATSPWGAISAWSTTATYTATAPASVVTYEGGTYVATAASTDATPSATSPEWEQVAAPGQDGSTGPAGTANAWGEIWPTDNEDAGVIAPGSQNVVSFRYLLTGYYEIVVSGCTASSPNEASIQVTPGLDANDPDSVSTSSWLVANTSDVGPVAGSNGELEFDVQLGNLKSQASANGDFSFTVNC